MPGGARRRDARPDRKKLIDAGRYWFRPAGIDGTIEDEEILGINLDDDEHRDGFEVYAENWQALMIFLDCETQWNHSPAGVTGLNYPALESVLRLQGIPKKKHPQLFQKVQLIERGAIQAMSEASNG